MSDDCKIVERTSGSSSMNPPDSANKSIPYPDDVENQINVQICNELEASHTYLAMAQYFTSANYFVGFAGLFLFIVGIALHCEACTL